MLDVGEYGGEYLGLGETKVRVVVVGVRAVVDDGIEVEVQVVCGGRLSTCRSLEADTTHQTPECCSP